MKLLTFNTHSLIEKDYDRKLEQFTCFIAREQPEVFCLQEVNQTRTAAVKPDESMPGFIRSCASEEPVREDNHAASLAELLRQSGICYQWTWTGAKIGYDRYDEGLAIFSRSPILETKQFYISGSTDYENWKSRKVLGIRTTEIGETSDGSSSWFYTMHMGWWKDEEEPFQEQWDRFQQVVSPDTEETLWLLGDFNSRADLRGEGYDYIRRHGWLDTWELAEMKDSGVTVGGAIDGWRDPKDNGQNRGMRIDYIWINRPERISRFQVVLNGQSDPVLSDHYGVMVETEEIENRRNRN